MERSLLFHNVTSPPFFHLYKTVTLSRWWRAADDTSRSRIKSLVDSGALEMVMGGWVMNDEALPSLDAIIDQ